MPYWMDAQGNSAAFKVPLEKLMIDDTPYWTSKKSEMFGPPDHNINGPYQDCREDWMWEELQSRTVIYRLKRPRKALPAQLFWSALKPLTYVCDRIKRAVEDMDLGPHRFIRMPLMQPDKVTPWPEPYWFWWCEHFIDCIVPDIGDGDPRRSHGINWNAKKGFIGYDMGPDNPSSVSPVTLWHPTDYIPVLSRPAIAGAHAWREKSHMRRYHANGFFVSDELVARLKREKALQGVRLEPVMTSELPAERPAEGER